MLNQLARYSAVVPLVEASEGETLLEVGSGSEGIARFVAERWRITICDRDFTDYGAVELVDDGLRRIEGDVAELPFSDGEFDAVVALDLLEHLPSDLRPVALTELARVTARRLVVGCPCGERALAADRWLSRYYRIQPRAIPPWLVEHLENGFPPAQLLHDSLAPFGHVTMTGNERVGTHLLLSLLEGTPYVARLAVKLATRLEVGVGTTDDEPTVASGWLRRLRGGDGPHAYRQIAVLDCA
jgi:SAM-dependent methyltransferase